MDDALVHYRIRHIQECAGRVLILVLMDDALVLPVSEISEYEGVQS